MRRVLRIIACLLIGFSFIGLRLPCGLAEEAGVEKASNAAEKEVSGEIESIDIEKSSLVLKQFNDEANKEGEEVNIKLDESTHIEKDGSAINLSDLKPGDFIAVECLNEPANEFLAKSIWLNE